MGVVNVTPDSFSDGGRYLDPQAAVEHGRAARRRGRADPRRRRRVDPPRRGRRARRRGAAARPARRSRASPATGATISIDTSKAAVAAAALDAGASYVNDVTAFRGDPELAGLVAERGVDCCLMHMLGTPRTMQDDPRYDDVVADVKAFLEERLAFAVAEGVAEERVMLDPGIGFGKTVEHNLELLAPPRRDRGARPPGRGRRLAQVVPRAGSPAASAASGPSRRAAANVLALERGASVFRVHDVPETLDALAVAAATLAGRWPVTTPRTTTTTT